MQCVYNFRNNVVAPTDKSGAFDVIFAMPYPTTSHWRDGIRTDIDHPTSAPTVGFCGIYILTGTPTDLQTANRQNHAKTYARN